MAKGLSFDDLNSELEKNTKTFSLGSRMDKSTFSDVTEFIPTGNYALNACISGNLFGGWPNNRTMAIAGPSGTGKTFLTLNTVKRAVDMGYNVVYYDSEAAIDKALMEKFGIDLTAVRYEPVATVQEFRTKITELTDLLQKRLRKGEDIPKLMVVLDSAGSLATEKEVGDALSASDKADMTRAKILKSIFRIITVRLAECKVPFIFTNHTYMTQSFISQAVAGGGTGPEYSASIILFLTKAQLKEGDSKTGIIVTAKPNKNRFAKPTPIKFHINYQKGMNPYVGLEQYIDWEEIGITKGKIEKGEYVPMKTARNWICKHLKDETVPNKDFFTEKVFTKEVLEKIDKKIYDIFNYGEVDESVGNYLELSDQIELETDVQ